MARTASGEQVNVVSRPSSVDETMPSKPRGPLVLLGASVRSLAESASRAGWAVHAADLFCDLDLQAASRQAVAVAHGDGALVAGYPWSLLTAAARFPPAAAWAYSGALENHPDLVDAIARTRPLAGNTAAVVRQLRDPAELAAAARAAGLDFPETLCSPHDVATDGTFLVKPLASAGGRGIRLWTPQAACEHAALPAVASSAIQCWQRVIAGSPLSASYCMGQGFARLIGVSRQLLGEPWCHAGRYAWCGAVVVRFPGSLPMVDRLIAPLERLGDVLSSRFQPVGLIGVDLVVDTTGRLMVIEVNPRPTASMELFERSGAGSIAGHHMEACGFATPFIRPLEPPASPQPAATWAKAVLFAPRHIPISQELIDGLAEETTSWTQADGGWPALADIPRPGQVLAAGTPVLTVFAVAGTPDDALVGLRRRVAHVDAWLTSR